MKAPVLCIAGLPLLLAASSASAVDERQYVDDFVQIPDAVNDVLSTVFPEWGSIGAGYLSDTYSPNLVVSEDANVMVTFVHEGAGYRNSLGYFTYTSDGTQLRILDAQLVLPNASHADPAKGWGGGSLNPGDTVSLRDQDGSVRLFAAGTRIGFFIVANGWNTGSSSVKGWNETSPSLPFTVPSSNASVGQGVFTTIDEINPETGSGNADLAKHVAMVRIEALPGFLGSEDFFLTGFEDLRRDANSDDDFNDLVVIIHSNPPEALDDTNVQKYNDNDPDPDGDGVEGLQGLFPDDPERAFVVRTPTTGYQSLVFEDSYPSLGDADYNDVVVQFAIEEVLTSEGKLKDIGATWHLIARGARYDHLFGLSIPGVPKSTTGSVTFERFASDGTATPAQREALAQSRQRDSDGNSTLRLSVFPSTMNALPAGDNVNYSNTLAAVPGQNPASARFIVSFDASIDRSALGPTPFDPFIQVQRDEGPYDIHLPGKQPFPDRPATLPDETGSFTTFVDAEFYPWAMLVPYDWRYPLEDVRIDDAYGDFNHWRSSIGQLSTTWYEKPNESSALPRVINSLSDALRSRNWTLLYGK